MNVSHTKQLTVHECEYKAIQGAPIGHVDVRTRTIHSVRPARGGFIVKVHYPSRCYDWPRAGIFICKKHL